jgi:signal transduction histidine kinase
MVRKEPAMRVTRLHWWTILPPTAAIFLADYARHELVAGWNHPWWEQAALLAAVLLVTLITSQVLVTRIEKSRHRQREAETLRAIGMEIASSLELDAVLVSLLRWGREILGVDCLGVMMPDSWQREMVMQARGSLKPRRIRASEEYAFLREAMEIGECREVDRSTPTLARGTCMYCRRCLALPLRMGSQRLGALCVGTTRAAPFSAEDRRLAGEIANTASIAIANALLHEHAKKLATLEERDRIARELHDNLAQVLGYLSMKAAGARELLLRGNTDHLDTDLLEMGQAADEGYLDAREAILGLRTSTDAPGGLSGALEQYLEKFSRQSGVAAQLEVPESPFGALAPAVEIQVVRVIQEALTNVRKHARAANAWVTLEQDRERVWITVRDDGRGFDTDKRGGQAPDGYGLAMMRERLTSIGGHVAVRSAPGKGTTIVAEVPLPGEEAKEND